MAVQSALSTANSRSGRKPGARARAQTLKFYLFSSPWLVGFIVFSAIPIVGSIFVSLTNWSLLSRPSWVGLSNYRRMFSDPVLGRAILNTLYFSIGSVALGLVTTLITALLLNQQVRFQGIFRAIFYLPAVSSGVATALLWLNILDPNYGLINYLLGLVGIQGPGWLGSQSWAMPGLIMMSVWGSGNTVVIFIAGLQGIPDTLYAAAKIDGAGAWSRLWHVTLPMMSPVVFFNLVTGLIASLQAYTLVLLMTNGGPSNATLLYGLYIYREAFQYFDLGYASALSWLLFLIILIVTALQFLLARRWVYYESA